MSYLGMKGIPHNKGIMTDPENWSMVKGVICEMC